MVFGLGSLFREGDIYFEWKLTILANLRAIIGVVTLTGPKTIGVLSAMVELFLVLKPLYLS